MITVATPRALDCIKMLNCLARRVAADPEKCVSMGIVAKEIGISVRTLEPILQELVTMGVLASMRGPTGGYRFGIPFEDITLRHIQVASDISNEKKLLSSQKYVRSPTALEKKMRRRLLSAMEKISVRSLGEVG